VEYDERRGSPVTIKIDENMGKVRSSVRKDHRLGIIMIVEELHIDKEAVRYILTTNMNMKKCVPKFTQRISQFLATKQIPPLDHALYAPHLALCGFFPFPKPKSSFKETSFQSTEDIHKQTVKLLKALSQNDFRRCFEACNARTGRLSLPMVITLKRKICRYINFVSTVLFNQSRYYLNSRTS
jgi:hypothetical protein